MIDFSKIPFVRLLIPFVSGILLYIGFHWHFNSLAVLLFLFLLLGLVYSLSRKKSNYLKNSLFVFLSDLFLMFSGFYGCYHSYPKTYDNYFGHKVSGANQNWVGVINDLPVEKEKFYKAVISIRSLNNSAVEGKVLAYFKKPFNKQVLNPGNLIGVNSRFQSIKGPSNPHEFNYRDFMANKGVLYQTFIDSADVLPLNDQKDFGLITSGLNFKTHLISVFFNSNLTKEAAQLCAALLTGYDDEISTDVINSFAHSGTLHVLSVSGLHTGILFSVIMILLGWLDPYNRFKKTKLVIMLMALWGFVFIAGFSPPVLRAAIMLSLISVGKYFYNYFENVTLNILAVSAFILLLFNPLLVYDVGFLLSYSAVLGILLYEPSITNWLTFKNGILNKIWQLCSVSIAAQISTLPLTLYFFHQFPLWFIFSNLLVIPICTVIMFFGTLFLLKLSFITPLINLLTEFVLKIVRLSDVSGWGYIDKIDFGLNDAIIMSVALILLTLFVRRPSFSIAVSFLLMVLIGMMFSVIQSFMAKSASKIIVYHSNGETAIDVKNANKLISDNTLAKNSYNYHVKNNHSTYNYPLENRVPVSFVANDRQTVLVIKKEDDLLLVPFLNPSCLILTNNCVPDVSVLKKVKPDRIVCDGSNSVKSIRAIKKLCNNLKIPLYSTKENGFLELPL